MIFALRYMLRRIGQTVLLLLVVSVIAFCLPQLGRRGALATLAGPDATAADYARITRQYSLDQPLPVRYVTWVERALSGDFGQSWQTNRPVWDELRTRLPASLELLVDGAFLGILIGLPSGLLAAFERGRFGDRLIRAMALISDAIPAYLLALLLILVFVHMLHLAPEPQGRISLLVSPPPTITGSYVIDGLLARDGPAARSALAQLVLPVVCMTVATTAIVAWRVRELVLMAMTSEHVAHGHALGLSAEAINTMALRAAFAGVVRSVAWDVVGLFGVGGLIELVFAWGGASQFGLEAIARGDVAVVQGYLMLLALLAAVLLLLSDLLAVWFEPRAVFR